MTYCRSLQLVSVVLKIVTNSKKEQRTQRIGNLMHSLGCLWLIWFTSSSFVEYMVIIYHFGLRKLQKEMLWIANIFSNIIAKATAQFCTNVIHTNAVCRHLRTGTPNSNISGQAGPKKV